MMAGKDSFADLASDMAGRHPEIVLVYVFGSRVHGPTGPLSDVDLAVYLERGAAAASLRSVLAHEASVVLGTDRVDLVVLNVAPVELAFHVIATGLLSFERSVADRVEYEAYVMARYGDYLPVLRKQREEILHGGSHAKRVQRYREALGRAERASRAAGGDR